MEIIFWMMRHPNEFIVKRWTFDIACYFNLSPHTILHPFCHILIAQFNDFLHDVVAVAIYHQLSDLAPHLVEQLVELRALIEDLQCFLYHSAPVVVKRECHGARQDVAENLESLRWRT
jgi:hypothetical protein